MAGKCAEASTPEMRPSSGAFGSRLRSARRLRRQVTTSCRSLISASACGVVELDVIGGIGFERDRLAFLAAEPVPEFFGDEGHQRVEQAQRFLEDVADSGPVGALLFEFDVPVAEIVPEEVPDGLGGVVVAESFYGLIHLARAFVLAGDDPAVGNGLGAGGRVFRLVGEDEAGGVPDFVGEGAGAVEAFRAEDDVGAGGGAEEQGHAHGVGSVLFGDDEGVDDIAFGLRHLLLFGVADEAVNIDLAERDIAHEFDAEHGHAGDPEEEDVEAGDERGGGVEVLQVFGLIRPAEGGERPEAGAEPGVEDVGILTQAGRGTSGIQWDLRG